MGKCVKCGKKGLFLKIDENQLCEDCRQELKKVELEIREVANIKAKHVVDMATLIKDNFQTIMFSYENGTCDKSVVDEGLEGMNSAMEEARKATAVVRDPDISKVEPTIAAAEHAIEKLHARSLELLSKTMDLLQ